MLFKAEAVEQLFLHHSPLAHHRQNLPFMGRTESGLHNASNDDFFNTIGSTRPLNSPAMIAAYGHHFGQLPRPYFSPG
jgi:hypothetical protein